MIALLMLLLLCCCVGESTAFVCPGVRTLKHSQNVQRFCLIALFAAERDNNLADLKTQTMVLDMKSLAAEKMYEKLDCSFKEHGMQIINKMDTKFQESNARIDKLETNVNAKRTDKLDAKMDTKFQDRQASTL
jgi:hypothetical protein